MTASLTVPLLWLMSYLVGALPFGYLVGRWKGVDLFKIGSGNIGATNVGRVLGRKFGILVFVLDFLKGAIPVAVVVPLANLVSSDVLPTFGSADVLRVGAAAFAFLGHLFPVYLRFRGGKGVATGAGAVAVLAPVPFAAALATWLLTALVSRMVSLASLAAVAVLSAVQLLIGGSAVVTGFCVLGSLLVAVRHRSNVGRLIRGTESQIGDGLMRQNLLRVLHVVAAGLWVGGAGFFNFVAAPSIFDTFKGVVQTAPSDRTANMAIVPSAPGATPEQIAKLHDDLGRALAGAAVGPIFPKYFAMQLVCAVVVLATAWTWRNTDPTTNKHRLRFLLALMASLSVAAGWWISDVVSRLRLARFDPSSEIAKAAIEQFATWHLVSLGLSFVTISLAFAILVLAAWLPQKFEDEKASGPA
ncbi:glycerol-3-phosphate 1-O-acyltransferase PlsY [Limnoglobus roseus]|uniref:Glycerol-3-phosphate acyltransferase n=1 Tax=Limnoglobus roseus TaxID=2598579 RepID=A0A5C1A8N5_9BACT|nr:glycerol-3-phosphate 1-O-acyltransferase PlsY [Limnoglobus roseus]QEL14553.1 acyl-phosphate glycerol 3-phosphate acyltransferase [Limnoglobus roseus]